MEHSPLGAVCRVSKNPFSGAREQTAPHQCLQALLRAATYANQKPELRFSAFKHIPSQGVEAVSSLGGALMLLSRIGSSSMNDCLRAALILELPYSTSKTCPASRRAT